MSAELSRILEAYAGEIDANVKTVTRAMGKSGAKALRGKSREAFPGGGGDYAKGWTSAATESATAVGVTIYNEHYGLPHLLEYGHVTRNGTGREYPRTPAHAHIAPVAEKLVDTYVKEVLDKL